MSRRSTASMAVSDLPGKCGQRPCTTSIAADVLWNLEGPVRTRGWAHVAFLVVLAIAVAVLVLVMRSAASGGNPAGRRPRAPRLPKSARPRPLAPDDDPDFLREISRRTRRDDGSPT